MNGPIFRCLVLSLCVFTMPLAAQSLNLQSLDKVIAVVDEDVVLQSELDRAVSNIAQQYASNPGQLPPHDVLQRQVLDRIVLIKLQSQRARETGIRISEVQIDNAIANIAQQNGMTLEQLRASLAQDGYSYSEFRETLRDEMLIQQLRQRFTQSQVQVSDSEIEGLINSNQFHRGEVHLGHILVSLPDNADAETIELGREKAEGVHELIEKGMEFSAAAIRYSNAPNALDGGDLGWRNLNEIPAAFVDLVSQMQDNELTPVIRGQAGFHILKLYGRRGQDQRMVEEYHARHIMINIDELTSAEQAERQIRAIHQRLLDGGDFAAEAREHSTDHNSAPLGGDMGWFPIDGYGSGVAAALGGLADNDISQPFQSDAGWHIVQRLGTRQQDRTREIMRQQASETIRARKGGEAWERYLRELRGEAFVESRLPAPGAS